MYQDICRGTFFDGEDILKLDKFAAGIIGIIGRSRHKARMQAVRRSSSSTAPQQSTQQPAAAERGQIVAAQQRESQRRAAAAGAPRLMH